jgi:hypothetical protein
LRGRDVRKKYCTEVEEVAAQFVRTEVERDGALGSGASAAEPFSWPSGGVWWD